MTLAYSGTIYVRCLRNPTLGPIGESFSWGEKIRSLVKLIPVLSTFIIVIGGIYMGIFTPTEAAAFGVFSLFSIAFVMRRMSWKILGTTLRETMHLTGMIFVIIIGGHMMGKFVVLTELTSGVVDWITGLGLPGLGVMLMLSLLLPRDSLRACCARYVGVQILPGRLARWRASLTPRPVLLPWSRAACAVLTGVLPPLLTTTRASFRAGLGLDTVSV